MNYINLSTTKLTISSTNVVGRVKYKILNRIKQIRVPAVSLWNI